MPSKKRQSKASKNNDKEATVDDAIAALEKTKISARTATGEWAAAPKSRDIHVSLRLLL